MTGRLLPRHRLLRGLAIAWLAVAVLVGAATLLGPEIYDNDRSALSDLMPLYFLSFPLGHLGLLACNKLKLYLYLQYHTVPDILYEGLLLWLALTVLGYVQWFVLLPLVAGTLRRLGRRIAASRGATSQ